MAGLAHREVRALAKFLHEVHSPGDHDAWVDRVLSSVSSLIPCHLVTYREGPIKNPPRRAKPDGLYTAESGQTYERLADRQRAFIRFARETVRGPARLSDFLSRREFHRSALYNEVYRPNQIEDVLAVAFATQRGELRGIGLHRDQVFSERDRLLLETVRPHLELGYEAARAFTDLKGWAARLEEGVAAFGGAVLELTADGRIVNSTGDVHRLVTEYFDEASPGDRLPETLHLWMRQHDPGLRDALCLPAPLASLAVDRPGKRLVARMLATSGSRTILLEEQRTGVEPHHFKSLGLTARENQVLAQIARGHTNKQIASELSISPRTVQRHLEHIYERLGVNTRTAAAALALAARNGSSSPTSQSR